VISGSGVKVPCGSRSEIVDGFKRELALMASDPEALADMAASGRDRIHSHFTWSQKADQIMKVYEWCQTGEGTRPVFF
jgi:glycosyltransferase involved in cell wall biosynthesis